MAKATFQDMSIRLKLIVLFMTVAAMTALAVSLPMMVYDIRTFKQAMAQDLGILGDVLANASAAALAFRDANAGNEVMHALQSEPNVTAACIYSADGKPFAKYKRDGEDEQLVPPPLQSPGTYFERDRLVEFRSIRLGGETLGTIYIESDLNRLRDRYRGYNITFAAVLLFTFFTTLYVAGRFQAVFSAPVLDLVQTAKESPIRRIIRFERPSVARTRWDASAAHSTECLNR